MSYPLKDRNLLSLEELSARDIAGVLELAHELKRARNAGTERAQLRGKNIALLVQTARTRPRTRCALEVAAGEQGASVSFVGPGESQIDAREILSDTARVLGRFYDAIEYRGRNRDTARMLAKYAGVPVFNGLTRPSHPTRILADYMTMQERCAGKPLSQLRLAYIGDPRTPVGDALLQGAVLMGLDFCIAAPRALWPAQSLRDAAQTRGQVSGARLRYTESAAEAAADVDFVCTDSGVSMARPDALRAGRVAPAQPMQPDAGLMRAAAANRLHTIKALLVATVA